MKQIFISLMLLCSIGSIAICCLSLTACRSTINGADSTNAFKAPNTEIKSTNELPLDVSSDSISYTIDISTPEGKAKLNKLSLKEAKELALTEALIRNGCAMLINPQYTHLKKGKRILRITVYGFPAKYVGNN